MIRYLSVFIVFFLGFSEASTAADAPYVRTPQNVVDAMLSLGAVKAGDYLIDLGSGDGRIVINAAKRFGARGMGVDLDTNLVRTATRDAQREGVQDRVSFVSDDLFFTDLRKATVITMYMSEAVNLRLRDSLFKLKPGTRVLSHDFDMGPWQSDAKVTVPVPDKPYGAPRSDIFLWVIPADFSGTWSWRLGVNGTDEKHEAVLTQKFQKLEGAGRIDARVAAVGRPEIRGDSIRFVMGAEAGGMTVRREYEGRIAGDTITGTAVTIAGADSASRQSASVSWRASRTARGTMDIGAGAPSFGSGFFTKE